MRAACFAPSFKKEEHWREDGCKLIALILILTFIRHHSIFYPSMSRELEMSLGALVTHRFFHYNGRCLYSLSKNAMLMLEKKTYVRSYLLRIRFPGFSLVGGKVLLTSIMFSSDHGH